MASVRALLATLMLVAPLGHAQTPAGAAYAVAYVEMRADAAAAGQSALERYRDAARRETACLAVELFAQVGRPGHFAVVETWRDAAALAARDPAPKRQLLEALAPLRVSGYDERPYEALTVAPPRTAVGEGVFVIAHVDIAPNNPAEPLLARLAEASRAEAGNVRFDVLRHAQRRNHFTVVEHWLSAAALEAHVAAAHAREYRDALQPLTGSPLDERVYTPIVAPRR